MAMNCDLPEGVVIQILLWLPVMSLLRFKSVCKSWCALIKSSTFIMQHVQKKHNDKNENGSLIFKKQAGYRSACKFFMLSGSEFEVCVTLDLPPQSYFLYECLEEKLELAASCNGILCIHCPETLDVILWNPATKQFRALPNHFSASRKRIIIGFGLGFGFDPVTHDYKVVRIVISIGDYVVKDTRIEVYSLSTDSWRIINAVLPVDSIHDNCNGSNKNGIFTWISSSVNEDGRTRQSIVSFDFRNEVFGIIPFPDVCESPCIIFIGESIACSNLRNPDDKSRHYDIWVFNEDEVTWTKLYTIGPFCCTLFLRGFSKNGEFALLTTDKKLVMYNPVTEETKNLQTPVAWNSVVVVHNESLVSITAGNDGSN